MEVAPNTLQDETSKTPTKHQLNGNGITGYRSEFEGDLLLLEAIFHGSRGLLKPMPPWDRVNWMKEHLPNTWAHLAFNKRWEYMEIVDA